MEIKIDSENENVYLDRKVINFTVKLKSGENAKLDDVKKELEKEVNDENILIYTIKNIYGKSEAKGIAHIYKDKNTALKVLPRYILEKNGIKNGKEEPKKE